MPKRKQFLGGDKKKGKQAAMLPATADEYLEAGVDLQEAGEKWRAGDAIKSLRFFTKALDTYEEGLKKFPAAFDIAFNKAQIQYQFTQYPKLLRELPASLLDLLQTALQSSRYALGLNGDNADVLFNTAQVLGSLAEAVISSPVTTELQPLMLLEEALVLFQRCLGLQEAAYAASLKQAQPDTDMEDGGASVSAASTQSNSAMGSSIEPSASTEQVMQEEQWVTIVDQITNETLIDTLTAQLELLILLCGLGSGSSGVDIDFIERYATGILSSKLPPLLIGTSSDVAASASITAANFRGAVADANFNADRIAYDTYWEVLDNSWLKLDFSQDPSGLVGLAESMITFNDSLRTHPHGNTAQYPAVRWQALSHAQNSLTQASKLPTIENLEKVHLLRGDVDILRFQLGRYSSTSLEIAVQSGPVLCKNAEKYYRGARKEASNPSVGNQDVTVEAGIKEGLAREFGGQANALLDAVKEIQPSLAKSVLEDAVESGIVRLDQLTMMGI